MGDSLSTGVASHAPAELSSGPAIDVYVTGFGKFRGVPSNPTTEIIHRLKDFITIEKRLPADVRDRIRSLVCEVLETSAEGCVETLMRLHEEKVCGGYCFFHSTTLK